MAQELPTLEAGECGLMCIADIAAHHGRHSVLSEIRRGRSLGRRGLTARDLVAIASAVGLSGRAVRVELESLCTLHVPCILHWDLNHFVVLKRSLGRQVVIFDPAFGTRKLPLSEVSKHFTGIALELTPTIEFQPQPPAPRLSLSTLTGRVTGVWTSIAQIVSVAVVLETFALAAPLFQQLTVDEVLTSSDHDLLTVLVLGFGLLLLIQTALGLGRSWMVVVLSQTLSLQWATNVFSHLLKLPIAFFERRHLGDITSRFSAVQAIQKALTTSVIEVALDGVMAIAALVMMLIYAPRLAFVTVSALAIYGLLRWAWYSPLRTASAERLVAAAKENSHFLETLRAISPLKLFGREDERRARWQNLIVEVQNQDVRTARISISFSAANGLIFGLENLVVLWLGARLVMSGASNDGMPAFTVGMLFAFISYKTQFATRVTALINCLVDLKMVSLHAERLADICLEPPDKDAVPEQDLSHLAPSVELRNVSFRYGDNEPWILKNASLLIEAGESVAIVGASGVGKTTLLKVALGLLKPTEGDVLFGGHPVQHLGWKNFRREIGTVMQEDVLLTGSLADNISFFDERPERAWVESCARMAQLHEEICRMPMGYETLVGDLGSGMSGGQRQRLLFARALYKRPRVLALDEATSHLDVENERAVTAAISHMQLTRLVIAHRPETIAGAKRVVQMRDGKVLDLARPGSAAVRNPGGSKPKSLAAPA